MELSDSVLDLLDRIEGPRPSWRSPAAVSSRQRADQHRQHRPQVMQPQNDGLGAGYTCDLSYDGHLGHQPHALEDYDVYGEQEFPQPWEEQIAQTGGDYEIHDGVGTYYQPELQMPQPTRLTLPPQQRQYGSELRYGPDDAHELRDFGYGRDNDDPEFVQSAFFTSPRPSSGTGPSSPAVRVNQPHRFVSAKRRTTGVHHQRERVAAYPEIPLEVRGPEPRPKPARTVQSIPLVSTRQLPDRLRSVFPFPVFNAVQSRCFDAVFNTDDNFVLSSPTGSGKTAVFELAICRAIKRFQHEDFKVVYQAPTKALCAERKEDWSNKFRHLDCKCEELTGDSDVRQMKNVQEATIIVTTPEKWDSITRKWKDHMKLMRMIKLFLIDEVHILREDRGATLEAIVSRTKSVGSAVRFIALSATVPNVGDIAEWLGRDSMQSREPAVLERFGEEFRPVKLQRHVIGYEMRQSNEFAFSKFLDKKLPEVISRFSQRKPIMIFCFTRKACEETAKVLASWWSGSRPRDRYWDGPKAIISSKLQNLRECLTSGVAYHHAGLDIEDRRAVAQGYLNGNINVICCTSTLAVGVNLPCHFVLLKGTASYSNNILCDYSDIEVMQMLGRAGRPQFDDSAVAVIMCRSENVRRYEKMVAGQEILESCLHRNLIEHLNAEVGLGTITDLASAKRWLTGTFLYVRLKRNPTYYKLKDGTRINNLDDLLDEILSKDIQQLEGLDLIQTQPRFKSTEYGDAMARNYILFETMKLILQLPTKAKISEILSAISQASEFREIRFRSGEKPFYKALNKSPSTRFPIPVNLDLPAHKVSLITQAVLGAVDMQSLPDYGPHAHQFNVDKAVIFQTARRMIRCVVDCKIQANDATSARNALTLSRSIAAEVWDDSPNILKQLDGIGNVAVRKLVNGGIKDFETLEQAPPHRIDMIMSRNPPFGQRLLDRANAFPKLRVGLQMKGAPNIKKGEGATVNIRAEIGFMNDTVPTMFNRTPVFVCFLAETSDGNMAHFRRINAKHLGTGKEVLFSVLLTSGTQSIVGHVMCDEQAGTLRSASLQPNLPMYAFPSVEIDRSGQQDIREMMRPKKTQRKSGDNSVDARGADEFDEIDLDLDDFDGPAQPPVNNDFQDIDELVAERSLKKPRLVQHTAVADTVATGAFDEPRKLLNGRWECSHPCKDKQQCRHLCCKDGIDKLPKRRKNKSLVVVQPRSKGELSSTPQKTLDSFNPINPAKRITIATKPSPGQKTLSWLSVPTIDLTSDPLPAEGVHGPSTSIRESATTLGHSGTLPMGNARSYSSERSKQDTSEDEYGSLDFDLDDTVAITPRSSVQGSAGLKETDKSEIRVIDARSTGVGMQSLDNGRSSEGSHGQPVAPHRPILIPRGIAKPSLKVPDQRTDAHSDTILKGELFRNSVFTQGEMQHQAVEAPPCPKRRKTTIDVSAAVDEHLPIVVRSLDDTDATEHHEPAAGVVDEEFEELKRWAAKEIGDFFQCV